MKKPISGIYEIRNMQNGKVYVGSAVNIDQRWAVHRSYLRKGNHHSIGLQHAWNKYHEGTFSWHILETCKPEQLIEKEQIWIKARRCLLPAFGYNMAPTAGSNLGFRYSEETKAKMSQSTALYYEQHPEAKEQSKQAAIQRWKDPEFREKQINAQQQRVASDHGKKFMKEMRAKRTDYSMMSHVRSFRKPGNQFRLWTPEEEAILRENFGVKSAKEIAVQLDRPYQAVLVRADRMGLKSKGSAAFSERMRLASIERERRIANDPEAQQKRSAKMSKSAIARRAREAAP